MKKIWCIISTIVTFCLTIISCRVRGKLSDMSRVSRRILYGPKEVPQVCINSCQCNKYHEKGEKGSAGSPGYPGIPGRNGMLGPRGNKGEPGVTDIANITEKWLQSFVSTELQHFTKGQKGIKGKRGDIGLLGPQGVSGIPGPPGANGANGISGIPGMNGTSGLPGLKGDRGEKGFQGQSGQKGDSGSPGLVGQKGESGVPGRKGEKGIPGDDGKAGQHGKDGIPGRNGIPGNPGSHGDKGEFGQKGNKGEKGIAGRSGIQGKGGTDGSPGTKGEKGEAGYRGYQGMPGLQGIKGEKGQSVKGEPGTAGSSCKSCPTTFPRPEQSGLYQSARFPQVIIYAKHSQSNEIPACPSGQMLWIGYSLLHTENEDKANVQDLGSSGSCLQRFHPNPFVICNIYDKCFYGSHKTTSYWLAASQNQPIESQDHTSEVSQISRCVVCATSLPLMTIHSQAEEAPSCPSTWRRLWRGFSFLMHTVNGMGGGQQLSSPGSCLEQFHFNLFIECNMFDDPKCHFSSAKYSHWLSSFRTTYSDWSIPTQAHGDSIGSCVVCQKQNDNSPSEQTNIDGSAYMEYDDILPVLPPN